MTEYHPKPRFDDKTRAEFEELGVSDEDLNAVEAILGSITADTIAKYKRIREAIQSGDLTVLEDDDAFFAAQVARTVYDRSTPEEQEKMLQLIHGNRG